MKMRSHLTPVRLIVAGLLGVVIASSSLGFARLVRPFDTCGCIRWIPFTLAVGLLLAGATITLKAGSLLKNGIRQQQWPEQQIEPLRAWFESPYCSALSWLLLVAYAATWITHSRFRALGLFSFLLLTLMSQFRAAVRSPAPQPTNSLQSLNGLTPIRSDHWGHADLAPASLQNPVNPPNPWKTS